MHTYSTVSYLRILYGILSILCFFLYPVKTNSSVSSTSSSTISLESTELKECRNKLALAQSYKTVDASVHISASPPSSPSSPSSASSTPSFTVYNVRTTAVTLCSKFSPEQVLGVPLINSTNDALEIGHLSLITYEDCNLRYFPSLSAAASSLHTSSSTSSVSPSPCTVYQRMALQYYQVAYNTAKGRTDPYLVHNFGVLLRSFGYHKDASSMFQQAVQLRSSDPGPYIELGLDYRKQGQCTEALNIFLQGLDVPNIIPGTHNEYALVSNIFAMLMNCGDVPDHLLYRTLQHPIITHSALYYPHVAMFIAHVRSITGQWGVDADQNAEQLLNAFISAQSIFLTSPLSYRILTKTFFSSEYQKSINSNDAALPLLSVNIHNWNIEKFLQYQKQVLLPPSHDNSTYQIRYNALQWLQQLKSVMDVNIYDISNALTDISHASILADSFANTAAFEISYIELPQWIMPFASALSSLIKQSIGDKESGIFPSAVSLLYPATQTTLLRRWYTLRNNVKKEANLVASKPPNKETLPIRAKSKLPKLRLAYLSPDFRRHAIGYMMFGTFASHNRSKVHVTAYHTKEIGNKFGLNGMFRIPQRVMYVNLTRGSTSTTTTVSSATVTALNPQRFLQCKHILSEDKQRTVIQSPDWSDSIVEQDVLNEKLSPYTDWSKWARQYITSSWRFYGDGRNSSNDTGNGVSSNPYLAHVGPEYCNKDSWTHTGRLAMVTDSFYSSLLWPNRSIEDIVHHMDTITQPHFLIDLGGPTFGNTGPVCRARPGVLTVHYLSGPISTGSRNDADFAIVDKVVLPPDIAFHAPSSPADLTLVKGYRTTHQPTKLHNVYHTRSSTIIAQSMVQGVPSLFHYRNESMLRYKSNLQPNSPTVLLASSSSSGSARTTPTVPTYSRTPIIRDFTESLVYINLPFQANTLPSYTHLPAPSTHIQDQTFNCPIESEIPSPCNQLYYPVLGGSIVPSTPPLYAGTTSSSSNVSIRTGHSSYLCPHRNRVIFAALYGSVKITPHAYTTWMNILRQVPNSELWLLLSSGRTGEGVYAQTMWAEATARGIHPSRIVFVTESPRETFWYMFPCIDVFLDTWIYGAHSTGADVLRFGIPVITRDMNTFASRVVSSLIRSIGSGKEHHQTSFRSMAQRLLISNTAMSYEYSAVRTTSTINLNPNKFVDTMVAPLARQLKLRLLPLVGGYRYDSTVRGTSSNGTNPISPPPPYDYVNQADKLERGYRTMWEIRSITGQGFGKREWTYEEVNEYKYPHIIVDPDGQG